MALVIQWSIVALEGSDHGHGAEDSGLTLTFKMIHHMCSKNLIFEHRSTNLEHPPQSGFHQRLLTSLELCLKLVDLNFMLPAYLLGYLVESASGHQYVVNSKLFCYS